ncbi:tetratricopeptide repeat protein [Deltaproteobacteria bacterium TL4]
MMKSTNNPPSTSLMDATGSKAFMRGMSFQIQGQLQDAIQMYRKAIDEGFLPARLQLAFLLYTELGAYQEALEHLELLYPTYPQVSYNLGFVYLKAKRFPEAIYYYKKAAQEGVALAYIQLGYIYEAFQDYTEAIIHYQIALFHGEFQANILLAKLYEVLENYECSDFYYAAVLKQDLTELVKKIKSSCFPNGRAAKRIHHFHQQLQQEQVKAYLAQGRIHQGQGHYLKALQAYQKAVDLEESLGSDLMEQLLDCFYNEHECLILLREAIQQGVTEGYYFQAQIHEQRGELPQALESIRQYNQKTQNSQIRGLEFLEVLLSKR